jgi:hypothetical protein
MQNNGGNVQFTILGIKMRQNRKYAAQYGLSLRKKQNNTRNREHLPQMGDAPDKNYIKPIAGEFYPLRGKEE